MVKLTVWCENQDGRKTAAGTVIVRPPSASRSWISSADTP